MAPVAAPDRGCAGAIGRAPPPSELTSLHEWTPPVPRRIYAESAFAEVQQLTAVLDPRIALSTPADLLAVGPRGKGLLKALHLGSTAHWLLVHPPSPMVVARHGREVRTAVVCADGSRHSARAVEALCALPWIENVAVTVLTIDDTGFDPDVAAGKAAAPIEAAGARVDVVLGRRPATPAIMAHLEAAAPDLVHRTPPPRRGIDGERHRPGSVVFGARGLRRRRRLSRSYVLLRATPSEPSNPEPNRHRVPGSGTG